MKKDINVIVFEDDFFSRNWMSLILARDWRTHIVADVKDDCELREVIHTTSTPIDVIIVDAEFYPNLRWVKELLVEIRTCFEDVKVIFTSVNTLPGIAYYINNPNVKGYLTKEHIQYSLAWAVDFVANGEWVLTEEAALDLARSGLSLPAPGIIMNGRDNYAHLTPSQAEGARLAFLFSMERADLADELYISKGWSYGKVNELYTLLGVRDLVEGVQPVEDFCEGNPILIAHFKEIVEAFAQSDSSKAKQMETLAFHVLTQPEIQRIS